MKAGWSLLKTDEFIPHEKGSPFGWTEPETANISHLYRLGYWAISGLRGARNPDAVLTSLKR
jgi:hypothetical protein